MRKRIVSGLLLVGLLLTLSAWTFGGGGNCDGWNVTQNENPQTFDYWTIDGVFGVNADSATSKFVADTSASTSRTFTVRWWSLRPGPDKQEDAKTKTLTRPPCEPTTTQPPTTTTVPETTTTQPEETTTTSIPEEPTTTVTEPPSTTTSSIPYDVVPTTVETTVPPTTVPTTVPEPAKELPFTGFDPALFAGMAGVLATSGAYLLRKGREKDDEAVS